MDLFINIQRPIDMYKKERGERRREKRRVKK